MHKHSPKYLKWFDNECKRNKQEVYQKLRRWRQNHSDSNLRKEYFEAKAKWKKLTWKKKTDGIKAFNKEVKCLSLKNPKHFWRLFSMSKPPPPSTIDKATWEDHFKTLSNPQQRVNTAHLQVPSNDDWELTLLELTNMIKSLSNDSSPGYDQITNKILKALPGNWLLTLKDLFNVIILLGSYPKQWSKSIIKPIYKSGDPNNTNNYRGISLLSCVGKLLSSILSKRLSNWAKKNDILCDEQFGFRKNRRKTDAVFILQCLIQKQILQRRKLYFCFVDLSKAFDCVNHDFLLLRLPQLGVNEVILQFLKAYHTHAIACVVTQNGYTNSFAISRRVQQGCPSAQYCSVYLLTAFQHG